ncbi:unnamed protein product [Mucor circinelloides]
MPPSRKIRISSKRRVTASKQEDLNRTPSRSWHKEELPTVGQYSFQSIDTYNNVLKAERQTVYEKKEREVDNKPDAAIVELEIQAENKNKVATLELSNADGECEEDISDATRRRTQFLVDTVRNTLFHHHDKTITADNLREFCLNLTDVEMQPCLLICNLIIPYVPGSSNNNDGVVDAIISLLFKPPSATMTIGAKNIHHRSGDKSFSRNKKKKKRTTTGQ